jgi:hypothetical protein
VLMQEAAVALHALREIMRQRPQAQRLGALHAVSRARITPGHPSR